MEICSGICEKWDFPGVSKKDKAKTIHASTRVYKVWTEDIVGGLSSEITNSLLVFIQECVQTEDKREQGTIVYTFILLPDIMWW